MADPVSLNLYVDFQTTIIHLAKMTTATAVMHDSPVIGFDEAFAAAEETMVLTDFSDDYKMHKAWIDRAIEYAHKERRRERAAKLDAMGYGLGYNV